MKLSIIIVNYRSWEFLKNCLDTLVTAASKGLWEIIVVDNHSDDGRLEQFSSQFPDVQFFDSGRNGGFAFACNLGAIHANGETLLFLNPDVVAEPESVSALLAARDSNPQFAIITSAQLDAKGRPRKVFDMFPDKLTWFRLTKSFLRGIRPGHYPNPRKAFSGLLECDWVSGSVFMIGRRHFDDLDGWREDYWMYVEDCDFCLRAHHAGLRVACLGDVTVFHLHGGSSRRNYETSVLTRTESIISKHLYVHLNFISVNRAVNHLCVFLTAVPKLFVYSLLDWLLLRQSEMLRTRSGVLWGVLQHYGYAMRNKTWHSRRASIRKN